MAQDSTRSLDDLPRSHETPAEARPGRAKDDPSGRGREHIGHRIAAQQSLIARLETELWAKEPSDLLLDRYQAAFRHQEELIALRGDDRRHRFVVVIPVADRPQHLRNCLESLLQLCRAFAYGGFSEGRYGKISVVIADDTGDRDNMARHRELARHYCERGIETEYFGLAEQLKLLDTLDDGERRALAGVLGTAPREAFHHKGPSIMRNIAYLKLRQGAVGHEKVLFYFIDSDQEFRVKVSNAVGDRNLYAVNYFHYLDRIFSETGAAILTGKVVGDPPVSPAVMAGNFIEDVVAFLEQIAQAHPERACRFHQAEAPVGDDASYHDMATLFGFRPAPEPHRYSCSLGGEHDHAQCFGHFSGKLNRFFHGEHPTRKTYYHHEDVPSAIRPARTIYTGNYVFRPEALGYFIPFATLKLRMAGPVLGRILKAELGPRFVSAHLPMLHRRTVRATGQSEFRPGIVVDIARIDLSGEFERQFYGDVMLFTMEKLAALGYPGTVPGRPAILAALDSTHRDLARQYKAKRVAIREGLDRLKTILQNPGNWWNRSPRHAEAVNNFRVFVENIEHNFGDGSPCYALIDSAAHKAGRHAAMAEAIACYGQDRRAWAQVLDGFGRHP